MKKFLLVLSICCCIAFTVPAAEVNESFHEEQNTSDTESILQTGESDLYDGAGIRPIEKQLSPEEKLQEDSSDLNYISKEKKQPDLLCSDEKLMQQIRKFIFDYEQQKPTNSVREKRARILLVRNLNALQEVSEKDLRGNFEASAALVSLKINEKREIHRICASLNNHSPKYADVYVIIYPYINYYKVVITNLATTPEKIDDATFIFSW